MRKHTGLYLLLALGVLLAVLGFAAGFALPFWDYSTTYAPVIGTQAAPASWVVPAAASAAASV